MKNSMLQITTIVATTVVFSFYAFAGDEKASEETQTAAATKEAGSKVSEALDGKVLRIENGKAVETKAVGDPKMFVFYHSASW